MDKGGRARTWSEVLVKLQTCRDFQNGDIFRQLLWYFWRGTQI